MVPKRKTLGTSVLEGRQSFMILINHRSTSTVRSWLRKPWFVSQYNRELDYGANLNSHSNWLPHTLPTQNDQNGSEKAKFTPISNSSWKIHSAHVRQFLASSISLTMVGVRTVLDQRLLKSRKKSGLQGKGPIHIDSYNVQTLSSEAKLLEMEEELDNIKWDIVEKKHRE